MTAENGRIREIDACGMDEEGTLCHWTGFDKNGRERFWGVPVNHNTKGSESYRPRVQLTESMQKDTIGNEGGK